MNRHFLSTNSYDSLLLSYLGQSIAKADNPQKKNRIIKRKTLSLA